MREVGDPTTLYQPSHSKGAQRKRRLARGIARWDFDRKYCAEYTRRIATLTLTIEDGDPEAAIGMVYRFWRRVRQRWLGTRYFCWLELQARGAVHYHCVWLNPPHLKRVNLLAWVDHAWEGGRTRVRFSDGRNGIEREVAYATAHSKKMGKKRYQQQYDEVPSQLRTFMSQRLEIPPDKIDPCLPADIWQYHPQAQLHDPHRGGADEIFGEYLELVGRREHFVPPGGRCSALDHRRAKRGPPVRRDDSVDSSTRSRART